MINEVSVVYEKLCEVTSEDFGLVQWTGSFSACPATLSGSRIGKLAIMNSEAINSPSKLACEKMICSNFEIRLL